jgi:hypothetical protein
MKILTQAKILKITRITELVYAVIFTLLSVYTPILIHYFSGIDGGRTYLPMPFFVLLAGLILGWRAGLITAVASPIISYLITGMPVANLLPFIVLQLTAFGAVAGLIKDKYNALISVTGALVAGWLAIGISLFLFSKMSGMAYVIQGLKIGLPGIAIQVIILPAVVFFAKRYFENEKQI